MVFSDFRGRWKACQWSLQDHSAIQKTVDVQHPNNKVRPEKRLASLKKNGKE